MLTLTRSGLTLNLNASVVPATGSSNVPILYMEEISDDYTGYLVEPRMGFTQNSKYTEFIGTYEEESQSVIIPAQCFANTGSVDITIALIDPEDPDHVEVCTPKKFSVTKAPMGTVVLPEEPTWQDYVLNYMKQNLDKLQGPQGDKGEPGDNATINVGSVTTLEPGQEATVQNTGTETNAVLAFGIPKGETGATGPQGPQGAPGVNENVLHADISKSENPSVDDAYVTPLQDLKLYGKSTQESTTGKNLWDISKVTTKQYPNGTGIVNNGDGSLTVTNNINDSSVLSNQKLSDICPGLQIGETYVLSGISSGVTNGKIYLNEIKLAWAFGSYKVITQEMLDSYVRFYADGGGNTDTVSNLQIEKGNVATAYEPYTGGKPSPSPDYPQEITKIEKVDCLVTGAQLLDISNVTDRLDTTHELTNTGLTVTGQYYVTVANIEVQPNTDMYISYEKSGAGVNQVSVYKAGSIAASDRIYSGGGTGGTFNTGDNSQVDILFYSAYGSSSSTYNNVTLCKGTQALPYEPYQSQHVQFTPPAPLYSILDGSVADYVDVARGKYVYQLTDVTFDGSEDEGWGEYSSEPGGYQGVLIRRTDMKVAMRQSGFCDKLTIARGITTTTTSAWLGVNNNYIYLPYANTFAGTANATEFRTWLATNNLRFIYPLATPTEQDIPAETLEALQALKTFNGVTNIFCNAPVSAQYEQSVQIVMNKILEQLNKLQTQTLNLQEEMINNV